MSALDGWIDIFRAGMHRDSVGRRRTWSEDDLDGVVAAHERGDPAPVVVGHPGMDAPAWGWIDGLRRTGDRLQARLRDLDPAFREAVEAGRYAGRSVALQDSGDGFRLQHLGFLGGAAPAVNGLVPTQFSGAPALTYSFAASELESWGWASVARVFRRLRDWLIEKEGVERADALIAEWEIEQVNDAKERSDAPAPAFAEAGGTPENPGDEAGAQPAPAADNTKTEDEMSGDERKKAADAAAERAKIEADRKALDQREAALEAERAAFAAEEQRRAAETELDAHIAAGRVLPAEKDGLARFMAGLASDDGAAFTYAEGGAETKETPRVYFSSFLARLPKRIDYGETAGGGSPADANDPAAVARAALTLMAADKTGGLTIDRAVRQVAGHPQEG